MIQSEESWFSREVIIELRPARRERVDYAGGGKHIQAEEVACAKFLYFGRTERWFL